MTSRRPDEGTAKVRIETLFNAQRQMLWGLAYRVTASASEADDIVQSTFVRLLERPPGDTSSTLAPWLTRVAMNLARDALRRRKRIAYVGPWLPEPAVEAGNESFGNALAVKESAGFAYLLALELLTPLQRAALILRDVAELTTREVASALETSEGSVRNALLRARKTLNQSNSAPRASPRTNSEAEQMAAMSRLMAPLIAGDVPGLQALLAADVGVFTDGGGERSAATKPVWGAARAAAFMVGVTAKRSAPPKSVKLYVVNGQPAWLALYHAEPLRPRIADSTLVFMDLRSDGRVASFYSVVAPSKLKRLRASLSVAV